MRKLNLGEQEEYRKINEDEIIDNHQQTVSNYFEMITNNAPEHELDLIRTEIESVESEHRKYYLYTRAFGSEY